MMDAIKASLALCVLLVSQGCARPIAAVDPRPNIDLPRSRDGLLFKVEKDVEDEFETSLPSGSRVWVVDWRTSLRNGFVSGFRSIFPKGDPNLSSTVVIAEAEVSFAPAG